MDVRSTGSSAGPVLALGIFRFSGEVPCLLLAQTFKASSRIPHNDRSTSGFRWQPSFRASPEG